MPIHALIIIHFSVIEMTKSVENAQNMKVVIVLCYVCQGQGHSKRTKGLAMGI